MRCRFAQLSFASVCCAACFAGLACAPSAPATDDAPAVKHAPIVGGQPASASDYPSTVAVTDPAGNPFCSGTLIGPRLVVTAAHCVEGRSVDDTRVVYGWEIPSHAPASERRIPSFVAAHPHYDPDAPQDAYGLGQTNDIGAIVLADPIPDAVIAPVLPVDDLDKELTPGRAMHIVGYGVYNKLTQQSGTLYRGITPHVRHVPWELLAGLPGEPDTCFGDSGGPAYIVSEDTLWLVGATSRAWAGAINPCGESTIYTVVPAFVDWLDSLPGADVDGGLVDGGFEGGGWPPHDASGGALLDVAPACMPPTSHCNPLTNEGCDTAAGQTCRLDARMSRVWCDDTASVAGPGAMCDETSRLCKPGYYCGPSIKCEKLCCSNDDCPPGVPCRSLVTLLGDIGTCGVVYEDASSPDGMMDAEVGTDVVQESSTDATEDPIDAADALEERAVADAAEDEAGWDATPAGSDYPGEPIDPGCGCDVPASVRPGWAGLVVLAAAVAAMRRRRGIAPR